MIAALRRRFREEPVIAGLFALAALASIAPIWIGRYVPLLDYPNHLSMVFVWRHLHDPAWNFEPYYTTNLAPLPYWAQYALVYGLALPLGEELAQKVFLSAAVLALPLAVGIYARRVGRDPRLALFAFPLAWNMNLAHGFLSYVAGLPILFLALAALDRWAERPSPRWGAIAAAVGASLYFFHILVWATFLAVGGSSALLVARGPRGGWSARRALLAPLPTLPALAIGLGAYRLAQSVDMPVSPKNPRGLAGLQGVYNDLAGNLSGVPNWLTDMLPGGADEWMLFGLGAIWLLLLASRPLAPDPEPEDLASARAWRLELAALVALGLYLLLPRSLIQPFYWYAVNRRIDVVMALLAVLVVRGRLVGARRILLGVAGVLAIALPLDVAAHFHRFNVRARGFDAVMEGVPRGKQVLPLMLRLGDPDVNVNCFNQWGTWVQLRQGGYILYNFPIEFPIRYKKRLAAPPWDHPEHFRFAAHGEPWDYYLIHGASPVDVFAGAHDRVRLVKRAGEWELWEKLPAPRPGAP